MKLIMQLIIIISLLSNISLCAQDIYCGKIYFDPNDNSNSSKNFYTGDGVQVFKPHSPLSTNVMEFNNPSRMNPTAVNNNLMLQSAPSSSVYVYRAILKPAAVSRLIVESENKYTIHHFAKQLQSVINDVTCCSKPESIQTQLDLHNIAFNIPDKLMSESLNRELNIWKDRVSFVLFEPKTGRFLGINRDIERGAWLGKYDLDPYEKSIHIARATALFLKSIAPSTYKSILKDLAEQGMPGFKVIYKEAISSLGLKEWKLKTNPSKHTHPINNELRNITRLFNEGRIKEVANIIQSYKTKAFKSNKEIDTQNYHLVDAQFKYLKNNKEQIVKTRINPTARKQMVRMGLKEPKTPITITTKTTEQSTTKLSNNQEKTTQQTSNIKTSNTESDNTQITIVHKDVSEHILEDKKTPQNTIVIQKETSQVVLLEHGKEFLLDMGINPDTWKEYEWNDEQLKNLEAIIHVANDVGAKALAVQDPLAQQVNEIGQDVLITSHELNNKNETSIAASLCNLSAEIFKSAISIGSKSIKRVGYILSNPGTFVKETIQGYTSLAKGLYNLTLRNITRTKEERAAYYKSLKTQIYTVIDHVKKMNRSDWEQFIGNHLVDGILQGNLTKGLARAAAMAAKSKIVLEGIELAKKCHEYGTKKVAEAFRLAALTKQLQNQYQRVIRNIRRAKQRIATTPEGLQLRAPEKIQNIKQKINSLKDKLPSFIKDKRVPIDKETILGNPAFKKTKLPPVKGARIYQKGRLYYHRDTLHKGTRAHLEVYNKRGIHLGEANPLTGELIPGTIDKAKKIKI